jgi:aspartate beta-hydroxylase
VNTQQPQDARVRQLVDAAERSFAAGRQSESDRFLNQAQQEAPAHPLVLNQTGLRELRQGRSEAARELFQRAVAAEPRYTGARINLATALGDLGREQEEMEALDGALKVEPRNVLALLQKGALQERLGKAREAASTFHDALASIPPGARLPAFLQPSVEHAQAVVKKNLAELEAFMEAKLAPTRAKFDAAAQERINHCIDAALGKRRIYHAQPTFLHVPKVPAHEFYPRELFPWIEELEAATDEIREEFRAARAEDEAGFNPYLNHPDNQPLDKLAVLNKSKRWSVYYLWRDGKPIEDHQARCPRTTAVLGRIPRLDVPGAGPVAFFSMLQPKTTIPGHVGVTNARLIVHLPLVIPEQCRFRVGSDVRPWMPGTAWVFDDTIDHEAWNDSDEERAVLIFDVWNPFMTEAERELFRAANVALREYSAEAFGSQRWDT